MRIPPFQDSRTFEVARGEGKRTGERGSGVKIEGERGRRGEGRRGTLERRAR